MSTPPGPLKLSVGASTGAKIGMLVFAIPFLGIPLFMIFSFVGSDALETGRAAFGLHSLFLLVPVTVMTVFVIGALGTFRFRAVLDGSVLEVRETFTTRRADLARARVWLDSSPEYSGTGDNRRRTGRRIPHLSAQEQDRQKVRLRLRTASDFLPPHELAALAEAVESGHRIGQEAEQAAQTADILRRLGTDPITRLL
ncbi:hypothetical protein AB0395_17665 [Streptosporangium sp. NPDC051023]|uniref:hypothetical protein n=1 Tax=Streptosporangium sp. NPDC051023 TaxID=3155410 RepID=UPI00344C5E24